MGQDAQAVTVTQALRIGFVLWEDGHGHWASDGLRQAGPCRSKVELLGALESLVINGPPDNDVLGPILLDTSKIGDLGWKVIDTGHTWVTRDPLLCVGCHQLYPPDTQFDRRGKCPQCQTSPAPR